MDSATNQLRLLFRLVRASGDVAVGLLSLYLAFLVRITLPIPLTQALLPQERLIFFGTASLLVVITQNLLLWLFGFYDGGRPRPRLEVLNRLLAVVSIQTLLLMAFYFLSQLTFPRSVLVLFWPIHLVVLFLFRLLLMQLQPTEWRKVAIIGTSDAARELALHIERYHWHGLRIGGHVAIPEEGRRARGGERDTWHPRETLGPHLGSVADLPDLIDDGTIDMIVMAASPDDWQTRLIDRMARQPSQRGTVLLLPSPFESLIGRTRFRSVHDMALIEVMRASEWRASLPFKRAFDVVVASLALFLSIPFMIVAAIAVRWSSPGPVIFRQKRLGRDRQPFELLKLRTMVVDAESSTGAVLASPEDPRITPVGRFLRRSRFDEVPQLLNVLRGEMSLVGPRPERPSFVAQFIDEIPGYIERFAMPPGLTGLAQVNGNYHSSARNKLRYDLAYLANWSLWLDLSILLRTIKIILTSPGT